MPVPATVTLAENLGETRGIELADPLRRVCGDSLGCVLERRKALDARSHEIRDSLHSAGIVGVSAAADSAHALRGVVRHRAWITGTSRAASAATSQASSSPPAAASDATVPPAASTVTTDRATPRSRS